jgi:hypothetical protein
MLYQPKEDNMTLREARKAINAYIKLVKAEHKARSKQDKVHEKELLRLAEIYINLKEKR